MVSFREAKPSEIDALLSLAESIFIPTYSALFPREEIELLFRGMFSRDSLEKSIASSEQELFLAEEENNLVGFCLIIHKPDKTRIDKIYVDPAIQGKGIGKSLLSLAEDKSLHKGSKTLELNVNQGNLKAIQFYKNQGFSIKSEEVFHAPNGIDYQDFVLDKQL